ncbi:hypothetical protein PAEPH01_2026 [Pancytospora epiphaga]|nr:hypothetical protein PAEPH01_2026 [Pancytospora epiphaga]
MEYEEEDSEEKFVSKIRTLKDVALNLTDILKSQTSSLKDLEPKFSNTLYRLKGHIKHLYRVDSRKFRLWVFYFGTSLFFTLLLLVLFFIF